LQVHTVLRRQNQSTLSVHSASLRLSSNGEGDGENKGARYADIDDFPESNNMHWEGYEAVLVGYS